MDTSYLTQQVATIIGQLHGLFDEIGVPNHERESRESELFTALSETLHNHLRQVTAEKNDMTEEAHGLIKTIRQIEASLEDVNHHSDFQDSNQELKIYTPLSRCLKMLKEKHSAVAKSHRERVEQVKKLVIALESYSSHLEPSFITVNLPPTSNGSSIPPTFDLSPRYVASLDSEFTRVYEEYSRRLEYVKTTAEEIVNLWADLGIPQAQTDGSIIKYYRDSPEQLGLHESDISRLQAKRDKLLEEKRARERKVKELKAMVESLWDRLGVDELDRKRFLAGTRGSGLRVINEFEAELDRLTELKKQNLHLFVEDARFKLQELWDALYFSEEEMLDFTPAFSDVYSDALLSAHESEIARLEALKEQRSPTLQLIEKHRSLVQDREELSASSQDASRLMLKPAKGEKRDPGKLLREEKMRKRIAKELPKVQTELRKALERWEGEYGRPFLVHGERYLDDLAATEATAKAAPSRSKTPVGPAPSSKGKPTTTAASSKPGNTMRPPPRPTAKTPVAPPKRNPITSSALSTASKPLSPSKIPARAPLSPMRSGNNSPERRQPQLQNRSYDSTTMRKANPPARAPPPKMRDVFPPKSQQPSSTDSENWRSVSAASNDSGPIRQVSPEDVYDEREHMSFVPSTYSAVKATSSHYQSYQQQNLQDSYHSTNHQVGHLDNRVISSSSSQSQAVSGSENWETYDDTSEPEQDVSDMYYAKLKAARGKRMTPEGGYASPRPANGKKLRSIYDKQGQVRTFIEENGRMVPAGSDAGWTDEDAF